MPKAGFKSITVRAGIYNYYHRVFENHRHKFQYLGVFSFSGFVTWLLNQQIKERNLDKIIQRRIDSNLSSIFDTSEPKGGYIL